jgi:Tol biopolymer transport system component
MIANDPFERLVSDWLHADAEHRVPDHLDAVLHLTSRARQRPAWSSPERWLPMDLTYRAAALVRPAFGRALLIAALALLLVGALLVVGSRQPRLPAPFGPADNGHILYSANGDIYIAEADASAPRVLVAGPEDDYAPVLSNDGTRFVFFRFTGTADDYDIMAAKVDGSEIRTLTSAPVSSPGWADWSPDGSKVLISSERDGKPVVSILATDGSRTLRDLQAGGLAVVDPVWRPPNGREIVFTGTKDGRVALYRIGADGTGLRPIAPEIADTGAPYTGTRISPDGTRVTYWLNRVVDVAQHPEGRKSEVHVRDIETGDDIVVGYDPASRHELMPKFSPDGKSILLVRFNTKPDAASLVIGAADGSDGPGRQVGDYLAWGGSGSLDEPTFEFSPDGRKILLSFGADRRMQIVDVGTGEPQEGAYTDFIFWQRVAR